MSATLRPLRPYQQRAVDHARQAVRDGARAVLVVAPTGAGKTRIGVEIASRALARGGRVLWLAHRAELLRQARDRLADEGVERVGVIAPWAEPDEGAPVVVASTQTLLARTRRGLELPDASVVVLDEAHHYAAADWGRIAARYASTVRVGLTATPERADGRPMGDLFDVLVPVAQVSELQRLGVLVPCRVYAPARQQRGLASDPVDAYAQRVPGERAFVFAANVAHARALEAAFTARSIPAATITATTKPAEREQAIERFRAGTVLALVNVATLTEGVDVPEASACILARGCGAAGLYLQIVGRILRCAPGKTHATLVDLTGAVHEHGLPDEDRAYALDGVAIARADGQSAPTVIACLVCGAAFGAWQSAPELASGRRCPVCGAEAPAPKAPKVRRAELVSIEEAARGRALLERLTREAREAGRDPRWVAARYRAAVGHWPPATWWSSNKGRMGARRAS